ncbi:MAG: chromosomal replication initiator protein DnaA, partial [Dehalococcoidia bacterium]|nr:chromosomal replication initiator protein DnaA [Dehalococcoidia bacterium]
MTEAKEAKYIWEAALGELQGQVNRSNYRTWLAKTFGLSYQNNEFVIGVANTFVAEYLDKNQRSLIEKVLSNITRQRIQVQFEVKGHENYPPFRKSSRRKVVPLQQSRLPLFSSEHTFDSFVVGSSNQIAYTAAIAVAKSPGLSYNPLFIQGGTGLGKTHLLHAIGHIALSNNLLIEYVRAEQYTNQLMSSLRDNKIDDFRERYRSVDMLLIDDVQFFKGKEKTEENFFYTFDELYSTKRQIVLTSDRAPRTMGFLEERLRSRFEGGLVTDIQDPDFETRLAILQAKARQKRMDVPSDVLELIAMRVQQNIRALEGSLNRIIAYGKLLGARLTLEVAEQALAGAQP